MKSRFTHVSNYEERYRQVCEILHSYYPFRFFATLSFQYKITDKQGIEYASQHVRRLNKKILGRHWKSREDRERHITGIAVLERAQILKKWDSNDHLIKDRGSCHFHFLVQNHHKLSPYREKGLLQFKAAWEASARSLNYTETRKLVSVNGTNVQCIHDIQGLYRYVLEEVNDFSWDGEERVFAMDESGVTPIESTPRMRIL